MSAPDDGVRDGTALLQSALMLAVFARHRGIEPPQAASMAGALYEAIERTYPEILARVEAAVVDS